MAKVSKYSILFYSGEQGYQNNCAKVTLADTDGNTLAFVRFKDPGMPYELDTEYYGIITMHPAVGDAPEHSRCRPQRENRYCTIGSGAPSCWPS
jgi:hypothetical protein